MKLVLEVLDHAPANWTPAERLFVAVLAEKARDSTRRAWPGQAVIARRTGLKGDSITRMCHRLAEKGWELREKQGVDKNGRPVYAHNGQAAVYKIPKLCPRGEHDPDVCFPAQARTTVRPSPDDDLDATGESPDHRPAFDGESPDDRPGIGSASPDHRPAFAEQSPDGGPGFSEKGRTVVRQRPDGGPPLTVNEPSKFNPHPSVGFGKIETRLPEATQIVLDGLRQAGYEATPDDARAVHAAVCRRYPGRVNLGYLRTMAANRSLGPFFEEIRAARAEEIEQAIRELQRTEPECEHQTAAGRAPHPTTGELLCPLCRDGKPALDEPSERTHPEVTAALDAYRANTADRLSAITLIRLTREATALHARGLPGDQLAELARKAARTRTGLLEAATAN